MGSRGLDYRTGPGMPLPGSLPPGIAPRRPEDGPMRSRCWRALCGLAVGLTGCVGDDSGRDPFAWRNPFKDERRFDPATAPAASVQAATRVHTVGSAVVAAN